MEPVASDAIRALKPHYRSGTNDLDREFFQPCLRYCTSYLRAVGYFSSSALESWAAVLPQLAMRAHLEIKLLAAPILSTDDRALLAKTLDPQERNLILQRAADRLVLDALEFARDPSKSNLRLQLLAWLLVSGKMELRFAFAEHTENPGIYHEKTGLFSFPNGDTVAFTGSANETLSGMHRNYESIDVFRSWIEADTERVAIKRQQFQEAWEGEAPGLLVKSLSREALARVKERAPDDDTCRSMLTHPPPAPRWRHQDEAVSLFLSKERGILEMATGTGKTRVALRILDHLVSEQKIGCAIVAADGNDLLDQWYRELVRLANRLSPRFVVYRHYKTWHETPAFQASPTRSILLASRAEMKSALAYVASRQLGASTLLVHDEVHRLGSPSNQLHLAGLSDSVRFRLGLSATPEREYDQEGTAFIDSHVGPVIFSFSLEDAIRRGVLCPFSYFPLQYELTPDDNERLQRVFAKQAALKLAGRPMSQKDLWIELAKIPKTSIAKLPVFQQFIRSRPELLHRSIIFVETTEYGERVLDTIHAVTPNYRTYYAEEDSSTLAQFARGELDCLVTCHRLSEGIDIRDICSVILFSSARGRLETIQRIGRCLRANPGDPTKRAAVVDFVRPSRPPETDKAWMTADAERSEWLSWLSRIKPEN